MGLLFSYYKEVINIAKTRTKFKVSTTEAGIKQRSSIDYYTGETIIFDSKLEKRFYEDVVLKGIKDGTILKYERQKRYNLQPSFKYFGKTIRAIDYISDFDVWYADGTFVVFDCKGVPTADAKIKAKLFKYKYSDIDFRWVSYTQRTGWVEYDELQKIRREEKKIRKVK